MIYRSLKKEDVFVRSALIKNLLVISFENYKGKNSLLVKIKNNPKNIYNISYDEFLDSIIDGNFALNTEEYKCESIKYIYCLIQDMYSTLYWSELDSDEKEQVTQTYISIRSVEEEIPENNVDPAGVEDCCFQYSSLFDNYLEVII